MMLVDKVLPFAHFYEKLICSSTQKSSENICEHSTEKKCKKIYPKYMRASEFHNSKGIGNSNATIKFGN